MKNDALKLCPFCGNPPSEAPNGMVSCQTHYEGSSYDCPAFANWGPKERWNRRQAESWIPVSQKLPGNMRDVFAMDDDGIAWTAKYSEALQQFLSTDRVLSLVGITHWMPIPPIEKGEG